MDEVGDGRHENVRGFDVCWGTVQLLVILYLYVKNILAEQLFDGIIFAFYCERRTKLFFS